MPDITMCDNTDCPLRESCYRHTAKPTPIWQSYSRFEPEFVFHDRDGYSEMDVECDYFIPVHV